ncbi:hypothetical protein [Thermosporothrix hazakensis]|uniref:hypothetical protein n=1 Tax=Thermosporothrix hazakensis TaxID=644383 RepID=UPI001B864069|nr:hypothetical protein [Thermosporothrix hazakensis]
MISHLLSTRFASRSINAVGPIQPITSFRPALVIHHRIICLFTPGLSGGKSVIIQPLLIRANINLLNKGLLNDTLHFSHKFI